jgi:hypothetical protein
MCVHAFRRGGSYSTVLFKAMDDSDHFLQMEPFKVPKSMLSHPVFLVIQRHESRCTTAPPEQFWLMIGFEYLKTLGVEATSSALSNIQEDIIIQRIIAVAEGAASVTVLQVNLLVLLDENFITSSDLIQEHKDQIADCMVVIRYDSVLPETSEHLAIINASLAKVADDTKKIFHCLTSTRLGATHVKAAGEYEVQMRAAVASVSQIIGKLKAFAAQLAPDEVFEDKYKVTVEDTKEVHDLVKDRASIIST